MQIQAQNSGIVGGNVTPMSSTTSSGSSSGTTTDLTANEFLSLLVTEMQNQDPTAQTDPNEYVNQMIQVNSLQQLIDINQSVSNLDTSSPTSTSTSANAASRVAHALA